MDTMSELTQSLEEAFDFKVTDYHLSPAVGNLNTKILIIHDAQDEEIPVSDALMLKDANAKARLVLTRGSGHKKILINRDMLRAVKEFISEK